MICLKSFPDQNLPLQAIQSAMLAGGFGLEKAGESFQPNLSTPCFLAWRLSKHSTGQGIGNLALASPTLGPLFEEKPRRSAGKTPLKTKDW